MWSLRYLLGMKCVCECTRVDVEVGVWMAQNKVLRLNLICWSNSLLGKHGFLMAKLKPLLPNELEGDYVVKNKTLHVYQREGRENQD